MKIKTFFYLLLPPLFYNIFKNYSNSRKTNLIIKKLDTELVLHGPFKGMKYIKTSVGSTLLPKLVGSYENELNHVIESYKMHQFNNIIDIGSAEGYYAVGFALNFKFKKIYTFDISIKARKLLKKMSDINEVFDKISVNSICTPEILLKIDLNNSLILSDCEGYEKDLFLNLEVFKKLNNTFLIIESHDFIDQNISINIISLYSKTHNIRIINSVDDLNKAINYSFCDKNIFSFKERYRIYKEDRPCIMNWLILTPKC
jgi:hypothetical protein